jgi:hypothetical protein
MDPDITMMIPGFLVFAFLFGVYVGHSVANTPGNRFIVWLEENRKQAAEGRTTEK